MTALAHTLGNAMWQADAQRARTRGLAFGCVAARSERKNVVHPLYRIAQRDESIEGAGTGVVARRRKR